MIQQLVESLPMDTIVPKFISKLYLKSNRKELKEKLEKDTYQVCLRVHDYDSEMPFAII